MKNISNNLFSKPKIIIPIFAVIVFVFTATVYGHLGRAPQIPASLQASSFNQPVVSSNTNTSLSFAIGGKLEALLVKTGDTVKAGEVIARLSAPSAEGAVNQAKVALELAEAQYAALNLQYANTKTQQDLIVADAYKTLLSSGLEAVSNKQDTNIPIISGNYTCDNEGMYTLKPYASSDSDSGFSVNFTGLESGVLPVKYSNPVPLGKCGLQVEFSSAASGIDTTATWTISIPNTKSDVYIANKNAYDLAVNNRDKVLADLAASIGTNAGASNSVAQSQVDTAQGAYQAALGAYQNYLITAPTDGTVSFVDPDLKVGQSVVAGKAVISISQQ